jgi:hypothetical protein
MSKYIGEQMINKEWLRENPNHFFVFGDNLARYGLKGAATLRHHPRAIGFVTKKAPNYYDSSYYRPDEYREVFISELFNLMKIIQQNPNAVFLISKLGAGLANRYGIWEEVIKNGLENNLTSCENVLFLWENGEV